MAHDQDRKIKYMRAGIFVALFAGTAAVGYQLKGSIEDYFESRDAYNTAIDNIHKSVDQLNTETEGLHQDIKDFNSASGESSVTTAELNPSTYLDLCNNHRYWGQPVEPCEEITLSDSTVINIEQDSAGQRLIETIDGLQSGAIESTIEAPLPPEESDPMMLYEFTG